MYRFALRPRWLILHVVVVAMVVGMVMACFWQLRRLHGKQAHNRLIEQNYRHAPDTLDQIVAGVKRSGIDDLQFTRVELTGTYEPTHEVAIPNHTFGGAPGRWVATPIRPTGGGPAVLVVRGWIPQAIDDTTPPINGIEPPPGTVTVLGYVQKTETKGFFGAVDPPGKTLTSLARVDVHRFSQQYGHVEPFFVTLIEQVPTTTNRALAAVPVPELDEGPHRGYAVQWIIFAVIATVGYPLILRRVARSRSGVEAPPAEVGVVEPGDAEPAAESVEGPAEEPADR